jgi:hypothetical protein
MVSIKDDLKIKASVDEIYKAFTEQSGLTNRWTVQVIAKPEVKSIAEFKFGERYHNKMLIQRLLMKTRK